MDRLDGAFEDGGGSVITIRFKGGLGNQLFQYATARALAERHGTEVIGDLSDYGIRFPFGARPAKRADRPFDLARLAPPHLRHYDGWRGWLVHGRVKLDWPRWLRIPGMTFYEGHGARFDPAVLDLPNGSALSGYFQSERYFKSIAPALRRELVPADRALRARVALRIATLRRPDRALVSVHVRRGDYLSGGEQTSVIALGRIRAGMARLEGADFLIFSDDIAWCRSALAGDGVAFSDFSDPLEDFHAMGLCDHHILANSTFSWWAAWLKAAPGKRTLAPMDWHGKYPDRWQGDEDIYAEGWERY